MWWIWGDAVLHAECPIQFYNVDSKVPPCQTLSTVRHWLLKACRCRDLGHVQLWCHSISSSPHQVELKKQHLKNYNSTCTEKCFKKQMQCKLPKMEYANQSHSIRRNLRLSKGSILKLVVLWNKKKRGSGSTWWWQIYSKQIIWIVWQIHSKSHDLM